MLRFRCPVAFLALLSACVSAPMTRPAPPPSAPAPIATGPSTTGPWVTRRVTASLPVHLETTAIITIAGDPATRVDTVRSVLEASSAQLPGNAHRFDGELSAYAVALGTGVLTPVAGLVTPLRFSVELGHAFRMPVPSTVCADPGLCVLQGLHDAWVVLPDTLSIGTTWSDSVVTTACRDRIPLNGTVKRRFKVVRAEAVNGRVQLHIDRQTAATLRGAGEQFGEHVELTGSSEGTTRYLFDAERSHFISGAGTSSLQLTFKSARRTQRVTQAATLSVGWAK